MCIRCAGIHRNLGVHISKVKSVNLDSWTPEQVVSLQQMGNSRARAVYEANLPDNFRRPQNDSSLESFIRAKYEHKKYIAREWVPPTLPKVNWEKEIDEEIEKQKRRKKTVVEKKSLGNVEVPQLPKPKNPSPKPGRAAPAAATITNATENKQNADLLGLQNGEDSFSGFLSAPIAKEEKKKEEPDPIKTEEESFFNQIAPAAKENVKLSKDSILALYGKSAPVNNFNQFQQPTSFQPIGAVNFTSQNFSQNGISQFPPSTMPQYQQQFQQFPQQYAHWGSVPQNIQMTAPPTNQFQYQNGPSSMPNQSSMQMPLNNFPGNPNQFTLGQFPQNTNISGQAVPNPFFGNQPSSLQQQFGSLSLNQTTPNPAPTLTSNIWH